MHGLDTHCLGSFLLGQTAEAATNPTGDCALTGHHRCSGLKGTFGSNNQPEDQKIH